MLEGSGTHGLKKPWFPLRVVERLTKNLKKQNLAIIINQDENSLIESIKFINDVYKDKTKLKFSNKKFDEITIKNSNTLIYKLLANEK